MKQGSLDPRKLFVHADRFHFSEMQLRRIDDRRHLDLIAGPTLVLAAFAAALYLKCLIYLESGRLARGHKLKALYRDLSPGSRRRLREFWDRHTYWCERL